MASILIKHRIVTNHMNDKAPIKDVTDMEIEDSAQGDSTNLDIMMTATMVLNV